MKNKYFVQQHEETDCGAACLSMICRYYGLKLPLSYIRNAIHTSIEGSNILNIVRASEKLGFESVGLEGDDSELLYSIKNKELHFPFIAHIVSDNYFYHFVVIYGYAGDKFVIGDPANGIKKITADHFFKQWTGNIISLNITDNFKPRNEDKNRFKKYLDLFALQWKRLLISLLLSCMVIGVSIVSVSLFQYLIDSVYDLKFDNISLVNIRMICLAIVIILTIQLIAAMIRNVLFSKIEQTIDTSLKKNFFNKLLDLKLSYYKNKKSGDILSRINDIEKIKIVLTSIFLNCILSVLMVIVYSIYLLNVNGFLFSIHIIMILMYILIYLLTRSTTRRLNMNVMEDNANIISNIKESISGIELIKTYQYEIGLSHKLHEQIDKYGFDTFKGNVFYSFIVSIVDYFSEIIKVCIFVLGIVSVSRESISIGQLISFYIISCYLLDALKNIFTVMPLGQGVVVSAERLNDVLDSEIEANDLAVKTISDGRIIMRNVYFGYDESKKIINNLNIDIKDKECIGFVGKSGCGKTTIAKLLLALYKVNSGEIIIGNEEISDISLDNLRKKITYVSQDSFVFSDTIKNNICIGTDNVSLDEIEEVCKMVDLHDDISGMPGKYDTILAENGTDLSSGQKQRIALARALLRKPYILILDEVTSNLDVVTEKKINEIINRLYGSMTIIIITHRLSMLENCDRIYKVGGEKITFIDDCECLKNDNDKIDTI